jgi:hypothetical protein
MTGGSYRDHGVSFTVPKGWHWGGAPPSYQGVVDQPLWTETFLPSRGDEGVGVSEYRTSWSVNRATAAQYQRKMKATLQGMVANTRGATFQGPTTSTMNGMTVLRFKLDLPQAGGQRLVDLETTFWHRKSEYEILCQYREGSGQQTAIERGCRTITNSFTVTGH